MLSSHAPASNLITPNASVIESGAMEGLFSVYEVVGLSSLERCVNNIMYIERAVNSESNHARRSTVVRLKSR